MEPSLKIPGFVVGRTIAHGALGAILEGRREGDARDLALKVLSSAAGGNALRRFARECSIAPLLEHRNIVRTLEVIELDQRQVIVMERLSGQTLEALRRRTPSMPLWVCAQLLGQLLEGLAYLQSFTPADGGAGGLVHGDLTPRNLFVCGDGVLKILDFGTARLRHSMQAAITVPGKVHGTFAFLAPEQARGAPPDAQCDVFQAGAVAYYLFSGRAPHGDGEDSQVLERAASGRPQPLGALRADLPLPLVEWTERAMAPSPGERFAGARAMLTSLRALELDGGRDSAALASWLGGAEPPPTISKPPSRAPRDPMVGRTLGEFVVGEPLGEGGSGVTYQARQPLLEREAVIKILRPRHATDEVAVQRFLREAKLASRLDHPYAAHVYAFGAQPAESLLWIAMERVRGTPLDVLLKTQGPISLERLVPLFERICEVVQTAHDHGIVHRDLKPANVMVLTRAGKLLPKLLDFGIGKMIGDGPELPSPSPPAGPSASDGPVEHAPGTLTQGGELVGSPAYMAPEQWIDPGSVGPRTDLYALGVLTYEALTGRRPFEGRSVEAIARAHATRTVPPLGEKFPAALDGVLRRAMSKRAEERYQNALELAAAFRAASGIADALATLPQLDDDLRASILTGAPQPLAEAVAGLEAARNAHQARDQVWGLVHVSLRYLALVALACRTRMGTAGIADSDRIVELLVTLRRAGLGDEQWLELTRELCRPFAREPHVYPIPEIVRLLFPDGAQARVRSLETLFELRDASQAASGATDADVRVLLARAVPELAAWLRALGFLADYRLVIPRGGHAEIWMGVRRLQRPSLPLAEDAGPAGRPLLVDGGGRPVLSLWPVVQAAEPMPGVAEELFLLEGRGRRGARLTATPTSFEREDERLWEAVAASYFITVQDGSAVTTDEKPPYRGLAAFTTADAVQFFGREREVEELLNRLKVQPFIAVVGPSGAGKSSFVHAGVVPALGEGWRCVSLRPGAAPLATLAARFAASGIDVEPAVRARDAQAVADAVRAAAAAGPSILVVIDQFEELLTLTAGADEQHFFAEAVRGLARSAEDRVRLIVTLRDDFLLRAERLPAMRDRLAAHLQLLTTPVAKELRRILVEPAQRCGYGFDDPSLPDEMVTAVAEAPGALALLSFTAAKMWDARDRHFRQMRRAAYDALGGVAGALAQHADETLARLTTDEQRLAREAFRHLVTTEGTRAVLTRTELTQLMGGDAHGDAVIERLVAARLLTASESPAGESVEVTHEALLTAWPRLRAWQAEDAAGLRFREQLRAAAKQWVERGRPAGLLWRREALAEYRLWRMRHPQPLTDVEEQFGAATLADAARTRRTFRLVAGVAFAVLVAGLLVLQAQRSLALRNAREAKDRLAELYVEEGRQALLAGDALHAGAYLIEAHRLGVGTTALTYLVARADGDLAAQQRALRGHRGMVARASFSPDGTRALTAGGDGTAKLWEIASGRLLTTFEGHQGAVYDARFDHSGKRVVTAGEDGVAIVWDAAAGTRIVTLKGHRGPLVSALFTPDDRRVITGSLDATARVWDASDGKVLAELRGHKAPVPYVPLSHDGTRIATPTIDKTTRIWDAATGQSLVTLRGPREFLFADFSPDDTLLVTGSNNRTAQIWDARTGALRTTLTGHAAGVGLVAFSPDGSHVLTGSADQTARIWDTRTGELQSQVRQPGNIRLGAFCSDGIRVITGSDDGMVRVWDSRSGVVLATFLGHLGPVLSTSFNADCSLAITSSADGTARIWSTKPQRFVRGFHPIDYVKRVGYSPDASTILAVTKDLYALRWDAKSGAAASPFDGPFRKAFHMTDQTAWFNRDGTRLISTSGKDVALWDLVRGRKLFTLPADDTVYQGGFSGDGRWLITGGKDRLARVWNAETGALVATLRGHRDSVSYVALDADGKRALTASVDLTAAEWELPSGKLLLRLEGHQGAVTSARFSPDGKSIVTVSEDGTAKLWDANSGKQLASLDGHNGNLSSAAFDGGGRLVVTSGDMTVKIWDADRGQLLDSIDGKAAFDDAEFSPDGTRLVTASREPAVNEWLLPDLGRPLGDLIHELGCRSPYRVKEGRVFIAAPEAGCN